MKNSLSLREIRAYLKANFPFDCLNAEITEDFVNNFTCEIKAILSESGCRDVNEEMFFLSELVRREYWESVSLEETTE